MLHHHHHHQQHHHQIAQASTNHTSLHTSKSIRRKRLQHYIRQIKRLVAERIPPTDPEEKLGTIDALDKTVELLRATPIYAPEAANPSLSPPHSWPDSPPENVTHINDDTWTPTPNVHFARRHIFSASITLPDGRITDFQKVTAKELHNANSLRCDACFLDLIPPYGRQALLAGAYSNCIEKKRILTRLAGSGACELLCEYKRAGQGNVVSTHIHALELESAFGPSKTLSTFVFTTRHTSSCSLIHLDSSAAYYIGYLPGEVINQSILYLLHPYDMAQIRHIHTTLSMQRGEIVRQRRLRWIAFNGSIIHTNSEWFAFWNPWTHKVDSVIGRHTLNEQPIGNADVLAEPCAPRIVTPLDELTVRNIESEITAILNKEPTILIRDERYKVAPVAHQKNLDPSGLIPSSGTHLGAYIDNLVETFVINAGSPGNKYSAPIVDARRSPVNPTDLSSTNHGNSTFPLTYNQINCLENVHRLLKSQQHTIVATSTPVVTEPLPENASAASKLSPSEDPKSPLPVPEQNDNIRTPVDTVGPAMPLTRELLQQHTRKWEQEYRDTWKKRLGLKRSIQQTEFVVPVSSKIFRDSRSVVTQSAPAGLSSSRSEFWPPINKGEYYRSLGPNPPPPPGRNFQITSVPLPPPLPVEERRSAFVSLPISLSTTTSTFPASTTAKLPRDISSQPINLSLTEHIQRANPVPGTGTGTGTVAAPVRSDTERQPTLQPPLPQQQQQQQHRSVIKTALLTTSTTHSQQQQQQQQQQQPQFPEPGRLPLPPSTITAQRFMSTTSLDMNTMEWCPNVEYSSGCSPTEAKETCAARLINMAQRAQQQQLEQKRLLSPLASSPVKEATDALMLLQETTSF